MRDDVNSTYSVRGFVRAAERVARQAGCSFEEAIDLMVERAEIERWSLGDLAIAVIEGRVRFDE